MSEAPQEVYDRIVNFTDIRAMREDRGCGLAEAKRYHQRKALLHILSSAYCDQNVRFILEWLLEDIR